MNTIAVVQALTDEQVTALRAEHGWAKETIRAIEAALLAQLQSQESTAPCVACGYQHGHAIGCANNPVDIALAAGVAASSKPLRWHELKTDPDVFDAVAAGRKTFEIRKDDRGYQEGDGLHLRRTKHTGRTMSVGVPLIYTGEECRCVVTHILRGPVYGLADGWAILSIKPYGVALLRADQPKGGA
jgi:hypothetical protein